MAENNFLSNLFDLKIQEDFGVSTDLNKNEMYKETNNIFSIKAEELENYIEINVPAKNKAEFKKMIEEYTAALHNVNYEENRCYYVTGYKEGARHMCDILK